MRRIFHAPLGAVVLIALVALLGSADASAARGAALKVSFPPDRISDVHFTYQAEIHSANPGSNRADTWVPLPEPEARVAGRFVSGLEPPPQERCQRSPYVEDALDARRFAVSVGGDVRNGRRLGFHVIGAISSRGNGLLTVL